MGRVQIERPTISSWFWRTCTGVFAPNEELGRRLEAGCEVLAADTPLSVEASRRRGEIYAN